MTETAVKMNPEWKAKWLEALRSGKYEQGRGALQTNDAFCCLGVLCDIVDPAGWVNDDEYSGGNVNYRGECEFPTQSLYDQVGLDPKQAEELASLNDAGDSFNTIAKYIEANL